MARKHLKPVSIAGIEFDALISEKKSLSATIPSYPVEDGFPVSDTIIIDPVQIELTLYISNTPVTWLYRHGSSMDRVNRICDRLEALWLEKRPVKIVTTDAIYKNMGITGLTISRSSETGYAREVNLSAGMIRITERRMALIPSYVLKSGTTQAGAGTAVTSDSSSRSGAAGAGSGGSGSGKSDNGKGRSILYGIADGLKLF